MRANMTAELCNMANLNLSTASAQHTDNTYDQKKSTEWREKIYQFMKHSGFNPMILLSISVCDFAWGSHTAEAYSMIGLTSVVYSLLFTEAVALVKFLRRNATVLDALQQIFAICGFHESYLVIVTPRYTASVTLSSWWLLMLYGVGGFTRLILFVTVIVTHLLMLKLLSRVFVHSISPSRSLWRASQSSTSLMHL